MYIEIVVLVMEFGGGDLDFGIDVLIKFEEMVEKLGSLIWGSIVWDGNFFFFFFWVWKVGVEINQIIVAVWILEMRNCVS